MGKKKRSRAAVSASSASGPAPSMARSSAPSPAQQSTHPHQSSNTPLLSIPHAATAATATTTTAAANVIASKVTQLVHLPRQQQKPGAQQRNLNASAQDFRSTSCYPVSQPFASIPTPWPRPPTAHVKQAYQPYHTRPAPRPAAPGASEHTVTPPRAPSPSKAYIEHANKPPTRLAQPRRLLVLLDLNGTLLYRPRHPKTGRRGRQNILRPGARELISYLFDNHAVMVFTSATHRNAEACVASLLEHLSPAQRSQLIGIQTREQLGLTPAQFNAKVQVYKPLEPVWKLKAVQASAKIHGCRSWDMTNTVLLDDSAEKARGNPHNLLQVPEFELDDGIGPADQLPADIVKTQTAIMHRVQAMLDQLKWELSAARRIRVWQQQKMTLQG
ncbi:hypothetical protein DV735_g1608, partial [Chaetothyriales sp. CBS 134920]